MSRLTGRQQASPGNRGMGRPRVPWRRTGREVLRAIEHEGSTMAEQARLAGISETTLRRGLRAAGLVVTRLPMDRELFPEVRNSRIIAIAQFVAIQDRLSRERFDPVQTLHLCDELRIPPGHARQIAELVDQYRATPERNRELMFEPLPGDRDAVELYDPDREPTPYRRSANKPPQSEADRVAEKRGRERSGKRSTDPLAITDQEIIRLYRKEQWGLRDIAQRARCAPSTIAARLDDYGVPRRTPKSQDPHSNVTPVHPEMW